jgi:hypothetical protein
VRLDGPLSELGLPPMATGDQMPIPRGAVKVLVHYVWAAHGELDIAEGKMRRDAAKQGGDPRLTLLADFLAECQKDPSIVHGALR